MTNPPRSQTNWQTPQELPDLRRVGIVALDTETRDAGLQADRGSSWPWRDGHVCGISIAYRADGDTRALYIPLRHPNTNNFDPTQKRAGDDRAKAATALTHRLLADETLRQALVEPIIRNFAAGSIATVVHHRRGAE
jgi:hypothetical protein